jgi:branched-chain amino acid transport system permease protein
MEFFLDRLFDGISNGAIYAALALALVMVYRATGTINFAQGEMALFTTYLAWGLTTKSGCWCGRSRSAACWPR